MSKQINLSRGTKNAFLVPLLVVSMLILGIVIYAVSTGTEIRSKAANEGKCYLPTRTGDGKLICKTGFTIKNGVCCPKPQNTPAPTAEVHAQAIFMYYCLVKEKRCVKTDSSYDSTDACYRNVQKYIEAPQSKGGMGLKTTGTCYATAKTCLDICRDVPPTRGPTPM